MDVGPKDGSLVRYVAALLFGMTALTACSHSDQQVPSRIYATEYGLGPDKWATAWLLTRDVQSPATLEVSPPGAPLLTGVAFDIPTAPIRRIDDRAAFEVALASLSIVDPVLQYMAQIVHQIEVNFWTNDGPVEADVVENAYRDLQRRYGRDQVTAKCYVAFFDRVYNVLRDSQARGVAFDADRLNLSCEELVQVAEHRNELIPEVPVSDVLSAMAAGRRVVFVDVRESDEFAEGHIPGALNIPLRDAGPHLLDQLKSADYVVSYCVKDFRGFEMAKALADVGVDNSVIMRPYGIKGWVAMGLPITGARALSEDAAREDLEKCLAAHGECLMQRAKRAST